VVVHQRLQRIRNSTARLVCSEPAFSHAAPLLHLLHWLPVDRRIKYKLCVLMFDVFHGTAPVHLTDLCSSCTDNRLRSSARGNFLVRRTRTWFADGSFTVAGLAGWNSPPAHIQMIDSHPAFCRHLKPICSLFLTDLTALYYYVLHYYCIIFHFTLFYFTTICKAPLSTG